MPEPTTDDHLWLCDVREDYFEHNAAGAYYVEWDEGTGADRVELASVACVDCAAALREGDRTMSAMEQVPRVTLIRTVEAQAALVAAVRGSAHA